MNTTTKVILGVALAAAAGAAIGMLLAPEKGKDLQKKIAEAAKEWLAEFSSLIALGKEVATEVKTQGQSKFEELNTEINNLNENS
jgi:gas vesicle protein